MAPISGYLEAATQHGPLDANLIILGLLVTLAFLWLTSSTVLFFLLGDDWKFHFNPKSPLVGGVMAWFLVYLLIPPVKILSFLMAALCGPEEDTLPLLPTHNRRTSTYGSIGHVAKECLVDWKLGIDSPELPARGRARINGRGPSLCNMDQEREEAVREMVEQAKIITKQARKSRRKTVAEMVEEQKTLRGKKITELMPTSQGLGGNRDMWNEYYAWMDVLEVIDEEEETEEEVWRCEAMDLKIAVDRS